MAAEYTEITDSNQTEMQRQLEHVLTDVHEVLRLLTAHDKLLAEFAPLLAQFRSPLAAMTTRRRRPTNGGTEIQ